jgi:hypothetical protein
VALRSVTEAESLLALVLKPGSLDGLYQDIDALLASAGEDESPDPTDRAGDDTA